MSDKPGSYIFLIITATNDVLTVIYVPMSQTYSNILHIWPIPLCIPHFLHNIIEETVDIKWVMTKAVGAASFEDKIARKDQDPSDLLQAVC